jgi:hypothetical protein
MRDWATSLATGSTSIPTKYFNSGCPLITYSIHSITRKKRRVSSAHKHKLKKSQHIWKWSVLLLHSIWLKRDREQRNNLNLYWVVRFFEGNRIVKIHL